MPCPGRLLRRHRLPVFAYGFVSFFLLGLGVVFSAFAIFERKSVISKVWLAGPTTMAVGLVLCGKVIIDCRPNKTEEEDEEEEYIVQADSCQKNRFMEHQLNKVRDSLFTLSNVRVRKSLGDNEDFGEDKCPDYESVIWNIRDDEETTLDTVLADDDSLCLPSVATSNVSPSALYYKQQQQQQPAHEQFFVDERHCPICIMNDNNGDGQRRKRADSLIRRKIDNVKIVNVQDDDDDDGGAGQSSSSMSTLLLRRKYSGSPKVHKKYSDSPKAQKKCSDLPQGGAAAAANNVAVATEASHSPLYQGEIFLFNDRQYLI